MAETDSDVTRREFFKKAGLVAGGALALKLGVDQLSRGGDFEGQYINAFEEMIKNGKVVIADGLEINVDSGNNPVNIRSAPALPVSNEGDTRAGKILERVKPGDDPFEVQNPLVFQGGPTGLVDKDDKNWAAWMDKGRWNFAALTAETSESVRVQGQMREVAVAEYTPKQKLTVKMGDQVVPVGQRVRPQERGK
jgi:hypothetical protein